MLKFNFTAGMELMSIFFSVSFIRSAEGPSANATLWPKKCSENLYKLLKIIYNLKSECFPKKSHVKPIYKSSDRSYAQNHRPITKISIFTKILEK